MSDMTDETQTKLKALGYSVVDASNPVVECGWLMRAPGVDDRAWIAASEAEAWQMAHHHHSQARTNNTDGAALLPVTPELLPCPFCWTSAHLSYQWPGSMTADMPDRPCRVICSHIDHDTVVGPTGYGKRAAITAWNTRRQSHSLPGDVGMREALEEIADPIRAMRRNAEAQGRRLEGGVAYVLSNDPGYLKEIARKALAERPKIGHASGCVKINCAGCGSDFYSTDYGRALPATQEDAERSGVDVELIEGLRRQAKSESQISREMAEDKSRRQADNPTGECVYAWVSPEQTLSWKAADRIEALSTPQRQEYDGEAVREALEPFACDDFETPITDEQGWTEFGLSWSKDRIRDWFGPSAFRRAREVYRAALAHPAQARDEMREEGK